MEATKKATIGLDIGGKRIGVSFAYPGAMTAEPLLVLQNPDTFIKDIVLLIAKHDISQVVAGLPQNTEGNDTEQTKNIRDFVDSLQAEITDIPISFQDESGTSKRAEQKLISMKRAYSKGDIDILAATYILQDYIDEHYGKAL